MWRRLWRILVKESPQSKEPQPPVRIDPEARRRSETDEIIGRLKGIQHTLSSHDGWVRHNLKQEIAAEIVQVELFKEMAGDLQRILADMMASSEMFKHSTSGQKLRQPDTEQDRLRQHPDATKTANQTAKTEIKTDQTANQAPPDTIRTAPDYALQMAQIRGILKTLSQRQRQLVYALVTCSEGYIDYEGIAQKLQISQSRARDIMANVVKKGIPIKRIDEFGRRLFGVPKEFEDLILGNLGQDRGRQDRTSGPEAIARRAKTEIKTEADRNQDSQTATKTD